MLSALSARCVAAGLVAALLVAGCADRASQRPDGDQAPRAPTRSGELTVAEGIRDIDRPHAVADKLYPPKAGTAPTTLGGVVNAPFFGTLAPPAVPDASGRFLAYHSFRNERPVLAVHDMATHRETRLAEGAYSLAWASNGTLAYVQGIQPRVDDPQRYVGRVVVRRSIGAPAKQWTSKPDRYVVAAWANGRLLIHRLHTGWSDLLVLEGPGRVRLLAERAALVAVSPDGSRAFITRQPRPYPAVAVVSIPDGNTVATLDLANQQMSYVSDSGSWVGGEVVAAVSAGLAVFRLEPGGIVLHQRLSIDPERFPTGLATPRADSTGRHIVTWGELAERPTTVPVNTVLTCDRVTLQCLRGQSITAPLAPAIVYNPSRPQ